MYFILMGGHNAYYIISACDIKIYVHVVFRCLVAQMHFVLLLYCFGMDARVGVHALPVLHMLWKLIDSVSVH